MSFNKSLKAHINQLNTQNGLTSTGWDASLSQDTQHEVTRSITILPGWDASLLQDTQHEVTRSITTQHFLMFASTHNILLADGEKNVNFKFPKTTWHNADH